MAEMMSKKQVSNLVVLVVAMVLMANYFVSCENTNIGDVGSNRHHHDYHNDGNNVKESHDLAPHHHHNDGNNVKEGHDLAPHPHHNGNRKMEAGGVTDPEWDVGCRGYPCMTLEQNCNGNCFCPPFLALYGFCVGAGCDC